MKSSIAEFSAKPQGNSYSEANSVQESPAQGTQAILLEDVPPSKPRPDLQAP